MLVDEVGIIIKGGHGGAGRVSFYGKTRGGPDGGDGGKGGDVYIETTSDIYALNQLVANTEYVAENGQMGDRNKKTGKGGKDLILTMPVGTILIDQHHNEIELNSLNQKILIAKGGLGGQGNAAFKSSVNTTPRYAQKGLFGQEKKLNIKLKLIADFGLIGLPNAGKSSLLNEITNASAKVGDYPFTTLEPNLGVLNGPPATTRKFVLLVGRGKVIADIPGLIEGAGEGRGLGHKFLKHIEKVRLLLHCISGESADLLKSYHTVQTELKKYNPKLLEKEEVILLTKSDLFEKNDLKSKIKSLAKTKKKVIPISIHDRDSLQQLIKEIN